MMTNREKSELDAWITREPELDPLEDTRHDLYAEQEDRIFDTLRKAIKEEFEQFYADLSVAGRMRRHPIEVGRPEAWEDFRERLQDTINSVIDDI